MFDADIVEDVFGMCNFVQSGPYYAYIRASGSNDFSFRYYDTQNKKLIHLTYESPQDNWKYPTCLQNTTHSGFSKVSNYYQDCYAYPEVSCWLEMKNYNIGLDDYFVFSENILTITETQNFNPLTGYFTDEFYEPYKAQDDDDEELYVKSIFCKTVLEFCPTGIKVVDVYESPRFKNFYSQNPTITPVDNKFLEDMNSFIKTHYETVQFRVDGMIKIKDIGKVIDDIVIEIGPNLPNDPRFSVRLELDLTLRQLSHISTYWNRKSVDYRNIIGHMEDPNLFDLVSKLVHCQRDVMQKN